MCDFVLMKMYYWENRMPNQKKEIGDFGEKLAADLLEKKGYRILHTNFRVKTGEIDIIAMQRDILVIVEVKTRKNELFHSAREAVTKSKQSKLQAASGEYLHIHKPTYREIRFDVIEYYTQSGRIEHFVDAF